MKNPRQIIQRALLSEKGADLRELRNQYVFEVALGANKIEIKAAVEEIFDVTVTKVTTAVKRGKMKKFGRFEGKRPNWKRAVVSLKAGDEIDLFEQV